MKSPKLTPTLIRQYGLTACGPMTQPAIGRASVGTAVEFHAKIALFSTLAFRTVVFRRHDEAIPTIRITSVALPAHERANFALCQNLKQRIRDKREIRRFFESSGRM